MRHPAFHRLHTAFLVILPRIELHGRIRFRHLPPVQQEEVIADMVALTWKWFVRLAANGKDGSRFPSALATFAARAVRSGRRVTGQDKARDVLSSLAQQRYGFAVGTLPDRSTLEGNAYDEALQDNTRTPVPDQVAFRHDFPAWCRTRKPRDRRVIDALMTGERPHRVADRHGLSPARVSQLRRELHDDWDRFCGEQDVAA